MENKDPKDLCLSLLKADSEEEVIQILRNANYWDDSDCWRDFDDNPGNFSTCGNQQSSPDYALVEKVVNSLDAILIRRCLEEGIDPEGNDAPRSVREAVATFIENSQNPTGSRAGLSTEWGNKKIAEVSRQITVATTGFKPSDGQPCITISDTGEGQTPDEMPNTFLSNTGNNKAKIQFVQGKWKMGGTGVLVFSGHHNFQFILSKRCPAIFQNNKNEPEKLWGFTIIRRRDPLDDERVSVYEYLAPLKVANQQNGVLRFPASSLPIFPEGREPYKRDVEWGSVVKVYEYATQGFGKSHILRSDGLFDRINLLLPDIALPIRLHECRKNYRGHSASFDTSLTGLTANIESKKNENLEDIFTCPINATGEDLNVKIYVFKKDKAKSYKKSEGILFSVNGQTHAHVSNAFFRSNKVGLGYLADSILIVLDCGHMNKRSREDLFMNSRDRLNKGLPIYKEIMDALGDMLKNHKSIRALNDKRREEKLGDQLKDDKPLENILEDLVNKNNMLSYLFRPGRTIPANNKVDPTRKREFIGKNFPTFFRFKNKKDGDSLLKQCPINSRFRVTFETDATNDYFKREIDKGTFSLKVISNGTEIPASNFVGPNLSDGEANLSVKLPVGSAVGDRLEMRAEIDDINCVVPFQNTIDVIVEKEILKPTNPNPSPKSKKEKGGIALPKIKKVEKAEWEDYDFDQNSALRIVRGSAEENEAYDFFINVDNQFLLSEMRMAKDNPAIKKAQYIFGQVILALGLIQKHSENQKRKNTDQETENNSDENGIENLVEHVGQAISPVIIPMIESLGTLDMESIQAFSSETFDDD